MLFRASQRGQERGEREQRGTNADLRVSCSETYFAFTTARREKLSRLKELNEKKKRNDRRERQERREEGRKESRLYVEERLTSNLSVMIAV